MKNKELKELRDRLFNLKLELYEAIKLNKESVISSLKIEEKKIKSEMKKFCMEKHEKEVGGKRK